jgi:hexokinase
MALEDETQSIVEQFEYSDDDVNKAVKEFLRQMDEGLSKDGTSMSQIPTYVTGVPNGTEKGLYMAVDLGGTNFRVCSIQLLGNSTFTHTYNKVAIPKHLMVAKTAQELFAFLAGEIKKFLEEHHSEDFEHHVRRRKTVSSPDGFRDEHIFRMGFTFSFPVKQVGINKGTLIRWTKGFDIPDAIGKDVCALLQEEIDKLHLPVKVAALVNDTVGTLMARSYAAPGKQGSVLGAIFGTGTNGAYVEKLSNLKKPLDGEYDQSTGEMVINTEWGSFDNQLNVLPSTKWDAHLEKESLNPGFQMYEKRVSGMFLGEILRLAIIDLLNNPKVSFFKDENSSSNDRGSVTIISKDSGLYKQWGLDTAIMSTAELDQDAELSGLRQALENTLEVYAPAYEDALAFKKIAHAIGRRAARLSAVAIGAIILQTGKLDDLELKDEPIDVGVDGSLVEHYPGFRPMIYEALSVIDGIGPEGAKRIRIGLTQDGSGVGAALIALVAAGMEKNSTSSADYLGELRSNAKTSGPAVVDEKSTSD